jgi:hypothetical protein
LVLPLIPILAILVAIYFGTKTKGRKNG